jgi:excisionase family DNA binding protein
MALPDAAEGPGRRSHPKRILHTQHHPHHRQERHAMARSLLTARQVQDLFDVDASTIYRMAGDGRLPAVRIGRQWRFPADEIHARLRPRGRAQDQPARPTSASRSSGSEPDAAIVARSADLATAALEAIAPALGVTMLVTDHAGRPITPVVNPAPAIAARLDDPAFLDVCTAEFQAFAADAYLAPRFQRSTFGFMCAHSLVRRGRSLVAMLLAGGIAPEDSHTPDLFHLDSERRRAVLEALPHAAALLSHLVAEQRSPAHT